VTAEFESGRKITSAVIECERGGQLRLANPFGQCRVTRSGKPALSTKAPMIVLDTRSGEVVEITWVGAS